MKRTELTRKTRMKRSGPIKKKRRRRNRPKDRADWNATEGMKYCDDQWAIAVKLPGVCAICGCSDKRLEAHHLRGRQDRHYRHRLENGICLCTNCHTFSNRISAHGTPLAFLDWLAANQMDTLRWWNKVIDDESAERALAHIQGRSPRYHSNPTADEYRDIAQVLDLVISTHENSENSLDTTS